MALDRNSKVVLAIAASLLLVEAPVFSQNAPTRGASKAPADDLPKASALIARFVEAIGGERNLRAQTSRLIEGRYQVPTRALDGPMVIQAAAPNLLHVEIQIPNVGKFRQGFDGTVGWSLDPVNGPWVTKGAALIDMARDSDFYAELNLLKNYKSVETVSRTVFDGVACLEVRLVPQEGGESTMYFDESNGLLVGLATTAHLPQGDVPTTTRFEDYREFDGIKIATRMTLKQHGVQQVMIYEKITHNTVDKTVFELPPPVKSLLDAPPAPPPPQGSTEPR